jgi:hypothetical protein
MKIAYEPHPVTPERKAELRAQGFKIIDARFAPQDEVAAPVAVSAPAAVDDKPRRGRPRKEADNAQG